LGLPALEQLHLRIFLVVINFPKATLVALGQHHYKHPRVVNYIKALERLRALIVNLIKGHNGTRHQLKELTVEYD
jgi:hypothetical protein